MKLKLNLLLISLLTISSCNSNLSEKPEINPSIKSGLISLKWLSTFVGLF